MKKYISLVIHAVISSICDKSRNIPFTELEASVSRVIHLPTQARISLQLTEADVGGCRVVLKTAYWILLYIIDTREKVMSGEIYSLLPNENVGL